MNANFLSSLSRGNFNLKRRFLNYCLFQQLTIPQFNWELAKSEKESKTYIFINIDIVDSVQLYQ